MPGKAKKPEKGVVKEQKQGPGKKSPGNSPWKIIIPAVLAVIIIIVLLLALRQKPQPPATGSNETSKEVYEITETDVFSRELRQTITGDTVSVFGMKLGDHLAKLIFLLGEPDDKNNFPDENIINLMYGPSMGLNDTGLIFHFDNDTLTRITLYPPFNKFLKGETQINHTKREVYDMFGIMDNEYNIMTRPFVTRVFVYYEKGLEVFLEKDQTAFSLVYPR